MSVSQMPDPLDLGNFSNSVMSFVHKNYRDYLDAKKSGEELDCDNTGRFVCGFPVPDFQRPLVWTEEQEIRFIESAWLGLPLGSFTIHGFDYEAGGHPKRFSGWVVDGQQRLNTLERYWNDKFRVFGFLWSELPKCDHRRFMTIRFTHSESLLWDEKKIRMLYNLLALGGTPHTEDQRV